MVVSLKANRKRILAFLLLAAIVVGACIFLQSGSQEEEAEPILGGTNEERVAYLESFGWQVQPDPVETREVMIPAQFNDVYTAYNVMQQAQGFDLEPYAGEVCTQYLYQIDNYPDETEVYATLLVYGEEIIGGDVSCAEVDGFMHGFAPDSARFGETGMSASEATPAPESAQESSQESSEPSDESSAASETVQEDAVTETESTPDDGAGETGAGVEEMPQEDGYPID